MGSGKQLDGQVALVTGASRGIGLSIARRLAAMGARLILAARDAARLESAESECKRDGAETLAVRADLTRPGEIARLVETAVERIGPVEILVNNAGTGVFGPIQDADEASWDRVLNTNLKAIFLLSRAVAPGMIRIGRGHIINVGSLAGKNTFAGGGIYCASKWGLMGLTGCMAEDLRSHGIRVSVICPGSVATDFGFPGSRDRKKMLQPDDIAHAVAMILTQEPQSFISEISMRPTRKP